MKVRELIERLSKLSPDANVELEYQGEGGCDTCGVGSEKQSDLETVVDLETRVILSVFYFRS